jgi:hypothetical protein
MSLPSRRAFLDLAQGAVALVAVGAVGIRFIETAEAMPIAPAPGLDRTPSSPVVEAQWGPPHSPRHHHRSRRRGRRRVCWWHRGRRRCGWR